MAQEVYFKAYEGAGISGAATTEAERKKLEAQLEEKNRRDKAEFVRKQYENYEREKNTQILRGDRASFMDNLAALVGTSAAITATAKNADLQKLFEESAKQNAITTPVVNQWASRTTNLANNPYRDKKLLAAMIGPNGEQLFSDVAQAQAHFRNQEMLAAIYKHYQANQAARTATDQHLATAREVIESVFERKDRNNVLANTQINPSHEVEQAQQLEKAQQALDLRVTLQKEIARTAMAAGMEQEQAQQLAAEVTAAFLHEQAQRDQILMDMKQEQVRVQNEMKIAATKTQAASLAAQQRGDLASTQTRPSVNLDEETQQLIRSQRISDPQLNPEGTPKDPTKFADGAYLDPNREQMKQEAKKEAEKDQVAPVDIRRYDVDPETGRPVDDGVDLAQSGAAGSQAQREMGTHKGDHAKTLSGVTKVGQIDVHDGSLNRDTSRVLERNNLHPTEQQ